MIKNIILLSLFILLGNGLFGFNKSTKLLVNYASTLPTIQQPGSNSIESESLKQLETVNYIENKIALSKNQKKTKELQMLLSSSYSDLGYSFSYLGHNQLSCFFYEKAHALDPNNEQRLIDYAIELGQQDRYAEAKETFEKVIKIKPDSAFHRISYGNLFFQKNEFDNAITQYDLALSSEPRSRRANYAYLMKILAQSYAKSKVTLPTKLELEKLDLTIWPGLLISYIAGESSEKDLLSDLQAKTYEDSQKMLAETFYYLGELYLISGDKKQATYLFTKVLDLKIYEYRETAFAKRRLLSF